MSIASQKLILPGLDYFYDLAGALENREIIKCTMHRPLLVIHYVGSFEVPG